MILRRLYLYRVLLSYKLPSAIVGWDANQSTGRAIYVFRRRSFLWYHIPYRYSHFPSRFAAHLFYQSGHNFQIL